LYDKFKAPVKLFSLFKDAGRDPFRQLEDKSKWVKASKDTTLAGIGPEREL
jgi:hypothetical protein